MFEEDDKAYLPVTVVKDDGCTTTVSFDLSTGETYGIKDVPSSDLIPVGAGLEPSVRTISSKDIRLGDHIELVLNDATTGPTTFRCVVNAVTEKGFIIPLYGKPVKFEHYPTVTLLYRPPIPVSSPITPASELPEQVTVRMESGMAQMMEAFNFGRIVR